jgi:adenine/guanine phosphoribosyltransferase-like PRPP-binding protein
MTTFNLENYQYPPIEYMQKENRFERERYLMTIAQKYFDERSSREAVSFGVERDKCICLERDGILLAIYISERGEKNLIALFKSIYDAFDYLSSRCLDLPTLPIDWIALNKGYDKQQAVQ